MIQIFLNVYVIGSGKKVYMGIWGSIMESCLFVKVPKELMADTNLSNGEKIMLIILKSFDYLNKGYVYPSQKLLMAAYNTNSRSVVADKIKSLESKGYIMKKRSKRNNIYYFLKDYLLENVKGEEISVKENEEEDICTENNTDTEEICTENQSKSCMENDTSVCMENQSLIRRNINKKNIYMIINTWNSFNINKVKAIDNSVINAISYALSKYSVDQVIAAIINYGNILNSDYYYDYQWTLDKFLFNDKGIGRFKNGGDMVVSYENSIKKSAEKEDDFDYEKYIK